MTSFASVNLPHLHLLLNHVPTVGSAVALGLLVMALVRRDEGLKHAALEVFFAVAVLTLPAYLSGAVAHDALRDRPDISDTAMRVHQDAAFIGFAATELTGFVAWIALWQRRRRPRSAPALVAGVALLAVLALVIMGRAATLGGEIRHPEIRTAAAAAAGAPPRFVTSAIGTYMQQDSPWAWPAAETVHFLGLCLTFGVLLTLNLRVLGVMTHVPFADVHRLLPWGMLGFGANLLTGMLFFVAAPGQYTQNAPFYWKIVFLMIAGGNFLYLTVSTNVWALDRGGGSLLDKAVAISSIIAWLAVIYAGRMLPFLGTAF
jgi:hypothetical protein